MECTLKKSSHGLAGSTNLQPEGKRTRVCFLLFSTRHFLSIPGHASSFVSSDDAESFSSSLNFVSANLSPASLSLPLCCQLWSALASLLWADYCSGPPARVPSHLISREIARIAWTQVLRRWCFIIINIEFKFSFDALNPLSELWAWKLPWPLLPRGLPLTTFTISSRRMRR